MTLPLTVATDLVARSVPAPTALSIVLSLTRSGVRDADLSVFQRNVRLDIERGADPSIPQGGSDSRAIDAARQNGDERLERLLS